MARYYTDDDRDSAGCLTTLLLGIIIVSVLIYIATIALAYIFIGIVVVVAIVGTVITLKNYIIELKKAIANYINIPAPTNWKLPAFFYRWFKISFESLKECWKGNLNSVKASFQNGTAFRFISIRRWFYWLLGLSVAVCSVLITLLIIGIHLFVAALTINILLYLIFVCAIGMSGVAIVYSLFSVFKFYFSCLKTRKVSVGANSFAQYICRYGYKDILTMIKLLWNYANSLSLRSKAQALPFKLLSLKKWFNLGVMLLIYLTTAAAIPLIFVAHMIIQSILFVVFSFANKGF